MSFLAKLLFKPEEIFRKTLENVDAISARLTPDQKDGVALFGSAILEDLKKRSLVNTKLHAILLRELKAWHMKAR